MSLTVKSVLCDDIRREDNGKLLIIGAYDQGLVPGRLPGTSRLSLWISVSGLKGPKHDFRLQLHFPGGGELKTDGQLTLDNPAGPASLLFIGFPAHLQELGEIVGELSFDGSTPIECVRMPVMRAPPESAMAET